jgi:hypothetical protein
LFKKLFPNSFFIADAAQQLMDELTSRFPSHGLMDALGVIYPQYWRDSETAEPSFHKHLDVIKEFYGQPKWIGEDDKKRLIPPLLDCFQLELQQLLFKLAMISNCYAMLEPPFDTNPLARLWRMLDANTALASQFSEYIKLAQIAMVHVLGSVEDERCFLSLKFVKDRLRNRLSTDHLGLVIGMHAQRVFTLESFPYDTCFQTWVHSAEHYRD